MSWFDRLIVYCDVGKLPAHLAALIIIYGLAAETGKAIGARKQFNDWVISPIERKLK